MDAALLTGATIDSVLLKFSHLGFSKSGVTRHRLHMDRVVRAPQRIDEERSAAMVVVGLADTLMDLEQARADGLRTGHTTAAVRAATEARTIAKVIFADLGMDSTVTAEWLADLDCVWQGVRRLMHADPSLALALADAVQPKDGRMAKELREVHDLLVSNKENAAA